MHDLVHRLAVASLLMAAIATFASLWIAQPPTGMASTQLLWVQACVGGALALSVALPNWRLPAIAAALVGKLAFLAAAFVPLPQVSELAGLAGDLFQAMMLAAAGAVFLHELRLEARWNNALPSNPLT